MADTLYYIQWKGYCGNCLWWWRQDGHGYTLNLDHAWKVTKERADEIWRVRRGEDVAWPVDAIDAVLRPPRQLHEGQSQEDLMPSAEEMASKQAQSQIVYTGFIAQEVEKAAQEVGYDFSGVDAPKNDKDMYGLRYAEFVVPLVKAVQEQQQLLQKQQQMIQDLQKRIEELEKK